MKSASITALALLGAVGPAAASPRVVQMDFKRSRNSSPRLSRRDKTAQADLVNDQSEGFYALNVSVGTPAQEMEVLLDTGSSDFWVPVTGSQACLVQTSTCGELGSFDPDNSKTYTRNSGGFSSQYGDGTKVSCDYGNDTVAIGGATLPGAIVGVVNKAQTTTPLSGIMGIGYPAGEAIVAESGSTSKEYPNIISQFKSSGMINTMAYSLWLNDLDSSAGSILFGGVDSDKFTGPLVTLPVVKDADTKSFDRLSVAWTSMSFNAAGKSHPLTDSSFAWPALMDSGTTQTALPNDLVTSIYNGLGVINDPDLGPVVSCADGQDPSAMFSFGFGGPSGVTINVSMSEVVFPITDNFGDPISLPGSSDQACGLALTNGADDIGLAILGDVVMRSAYFVYDLDNNQISIAQTKFNVSTSNVKEISGSAIPGASQVGATVTAAPPSAATAAESVVPGIQSSHALSETGTAIAGATPSATFGWHPSSSTSSAASPSVKLAKFDPALLVAGAVTLISALAGAMYML